MKIEELVRIGELKFYSRDLRVTLTIRQYFQTLLTTLWVEEDGFSGKRPFGNSGWKYGLYDTLVKNGIIDGIIDETGDVECCDEVQANKIIKDLINHFFRKP